MKNRLQKLLSVKSIVTVIMTVIFAYLCVKKIMTGEQFLVIYTTVIAFYFGTQTNKNNKGEDN